mmetsp:Transcript_36107/g.101644  ORF Transcript_36107/g.101644 Transcript_36107/m.101644 type:complete len:280 (+) Transcript_36107:627-1466(+)
MNVAPCRSEQIPLLVVLIHGADVRLAIGLRRRVLPRAPAADLHNLDLVVGIVRVLPQIATPGSMLAVRARGRVLLVGPRTWASLLRVATPAGVPVNHLQRHELLIRVVFVASLRPALSGVVVPAPVVRARGRVLVIGAAGALMLPGRWHDERPCRVAKLRLVVLVLLLDALPRGCAPRDVRGVPSLVRAGVLLIHFLRGAILPGVEMLLENVACQIDCFGVLLFQVVNVPTLCQLCDQEGYSQVRRKGAWNFASMGSRSHRSDHIRQAKSVRACEDATF